MSVRKLQIESTLKRAISLVLARRVSDPRIVGLVSITHVDVSPDLNDALVYISVMPEKFQKKTLAGLRHATGYIHTLVRDEVALKSVPRLDFRLDVALKKEATVLAAINRAIAKDKEGQAQRPAPEGEPAPAPAPGGAGEAGGGDDAAQAETGPEDLKQ